MALNWCAVFLLMLRFYLSVASDCDKIYVRATCADQMMIYADGRQYASHNDKSYVKSVTIPSDTQVVAIQCTTSVSNEGGILATFGMEHFGDYMTDATWRCSNSYNNDWNTVYFDDSKWNYASVLANNTGTDTTYNKVASVADYVNWIWTDSPSAQSGDSTVYCRGNIGMKPTTDNYGRRFVVGFLENLILDYERDIKLLITTLKPTDVTVRITTPRITGGSLHVDQVLTVSAGQVATYILPRRLRHDNNHKIQDKGILITSTDSIRIIGENQEKHSTDMALYIPITSLGAENDANEYYAVSWDAASDSRMLVVAAFDNTTITINSPSTNILFQGVGHPAGVPFSFTLEKKYQSLQFGSPSGFTGTYIGTNKPVSAFSGNKKTPINNYVGGRSADHLVEQLLPIKTWGLRFVLTPLPYSNNGSIARMGEHLETYKIVAASDNTDVTIDVYDNDGTFLNTESFSLNMGEVHNRDHKRGTIGVVTSTEGIMVAQFATTMTAPSAAHNTVGNCIGDPWLQLIPPLQEYFNDYAIVTPSLIETAKCKPRHFITIIVEKAKKAGVVINNVNVDWSTCKADVTCADIPTTNLMYLTINVAYGSHRVQHVEPSVSFYVLFFGYGVFDSYATLGGTRLAPINGHCVPTKPRMGDGIDNDCDNKIDEDACARNDKTKDCAPPSPINGGWSEWAEAGPCECKSGSSTGRMRYRRTCTNPLPTHNGWPCLDKEMGAWKREDCQCVPVDGGWSDWGLWSDCDKKCGLGKVSRKRKCTNPYPGNGGAECVGEAEESYACYIKECKARPSLCSEDISSSDSVSDRLLPYGPNAGDTVALKVNNQRWAENLYAREVQIPNTAFLENNRCTQCYMGITSSGYVAIRSKRSRYNRRMYMRRRPRKWKDAFNPNRRWGMEFSGAYILSPFWSDTEYQIGGPSQVYYHIYHRRDRKTDHRTKDILELLNSKVHQYTAYKDFSAKYVAVVTWENMVPRVRPCSNEQNTFQLALISDQRRGLTFALYLYGDMTWYVPRPIHVGYYLQTKLNGQKVEYTERRFSDLKRPFSKRSYEIDTRRNKKTGIKGEHFHVLATGYTQPSEEELCLDWYDRELEHTPVPYYSWYKKWDTPRYLKYVHNVGKWARACPCDVRSARDDWRWRRDTIERDQGNLCFVQKTPVWYTSQTCCYDRGTKSLITGSDGSGGHTYLFHPRWWWSKGFYRQHDAPYKKYCCEDSDNCDKFYEIRPNNDCEKYRPPTLSWSWGDPHIRTLDGHIYIFNGHGEYILIKTEDQNFTLQARTEQLWDSDGKVLKATVFTAIAAQDREGDRVQVELNGSRDGLSIHAHDKDITTWFSGAADNDDHDNFTKVVITKLNQTTVALTFNSGFSVSIAFGLKQLAITTSAPDEFKELTAGLLGVLNGDKTDDYTLSDGNTLNINILDRQVHSDFGEHWRTTPQESLFMYHGSNNHSSYLPPSDYTPVFFEDLRATFTVTEWNTLNHTCSGMRECLFDYAVTGDIEFALLTRQTDEQNKDASINLGNTSPQIAVNPRLDGSLNQESTLTVSATDVDATDTVTLNMVMIKLADGTDLSAEASFVNGEFKWTPKTSEPVKLTFTAVDSRGASSSAHTIGIRFCECVNGVCQFDEIQGGQDPTSPFLVVECLCNSGWTGDNCTEDIDGCLDNPCGCDPGQTCTGSDTTCTDVPAALDNTYPDGAFECGSCNPGYERKNGTNSDCINIDECTLGTDNCDTNNGWCGDNDGSFTCECYEGYRLDDDMRNCIDIDECDEQTYDCAHSCQNTAGSYRCTCEAGHSLSNTDKTTCDISSTIATVCNTLGCDHCRLVAGSSNVECFCPSGYYLDSNDKTCRDVDECAPGLGHQCNTSVSTCVNTPGTYNCVCKDGYQLQDDSRTCTECQPGFWGPDCVNLCSCKEGTTCDLTTGCSECDESGFVGGNCDEDIDECLHGDPCKDNTDSCVNTQGSFYCSCLSGYEPVSQTQCRDKDECEYIPCQNGGECTDTAGGYTCDCVDGFIWDNCETDVNECASDPCQNNGECVDMANQYRCLCTWKYTGVHCERYSDPLYKEVPVDEDNELDSDALAQVAGASSTVIIAATVTVVAVAIAALVGGVMLYKKNKNLVKTMSQKVGPVDNVNHYGPSVYYNDLPVTKTASPAWNTINTPRDIQLIPVTPRQGNERSVEDC